MQCPKLQVFLENTNGITFPDEQIIIKIFIFFKNKIPKETSYSLEMIKGDYSRIVHGINNPPDNSPDFFSIYSFDHSISY